MNMSESEVAEEVAFIEVEHIWPLWPILPVKKRGETMSDRGIGIVLSERIGMGGPTVVHLMNMLQLKPGVTYAEQLADVEKIEFSSIKEMVENGWVGD